MARAKEFFLEFGLKILGEAILEGGLVDRVTGLRDVKSEIVMMGMPGGTQDGEANIELVKFHNPVDEKGVQPSLANTLGIRHITFDVEDIEALAAKLKTGGAEFFSEIQNYQDTYKLCYVRGPEGIILELAEKIK
jgi:catechol 2,3-dioxygenase-like lactoylglutathione lyase family enzyme